MSKNYEDKYTNCVVIRRISTVIIHPAFVVGSPQHRMIVYYVMIGMIGFNEYFLVIFREKY
jgi:hypothetical protein